MEMPINYQDIFQFYLHMPITLLNDVTDEEILEQCYEESAIPIVIIRDKKHPLFRKISKEFKRRGIKVELKVLILAIGYNTPYLS